jgi:hypothetical protein
MRRDRRQPLVIDVRRSIRLALAAFAAIVFVSAPLRAQIPFSLEGLLDGEFWSTTPYSNLLTRNNGQPGGVGRLQLWTALEPIPRLVLFAQGRVEGGRASVYANEYEADVDQIGARLALSRAFVVDAGRLVPVVGTFPARRFSNRNPLIGNPDTYTLAYPWGAQISGEASRIDYRVALVSLPPSHEGYVPPPTEKLRPAFGAGFTPFIGFRIGGSYTHGPYLNDGLTATQLRDQSWDSYNQRVFALDLAFARGYLETRAEAARSTYQVPGRPGAILGYVYYGEAKYTFTPRFFVAGRAERNNYPFIRAFGNSWVARSVDFVDGELGVGYRVSASTLIKGSVRSDRWWVAPGSAGFLGQGGSCACAVKFKLSS